MAAAQNQLNNNIEAANQQPLPLHTGKGILTDAPSPQGNKLLETVKQHLSQVVRHQWPISSTVISQDAPGAANHPGGAGNAATQSEHNNREKAGYAMIMSFVEFGSQLHIKLSSPPYQHTGSVVWTYLNGPNIIYLPPSSEAASKHKKWVRSLS